jgi:hypothetical protein
MTFWGLLVIAAIFAFFVMLFFKLLPPYIEYGKVKATLESIAKQPDAGAMEKTQIKAAFDRRFSIEDIYDIDLNKALVVEKKPGSMSIRIFYDRKVPLAYNVTALIEFDHTVQVNVR